MRIRRMQPIDLDFAATCTANEGWNSETRETFEIFLARDRSGCFVAHKADKTIGICVATKYRQHGFIGELIVIKEMRGHGLGQQLMQHSIKYLQKNCIEHIYLDGVTPAISLYERLGFRKICKSLRFMGQLSGKPHPKVRPAILPDLEKIISIDRQAFGDDRGAFLKEFFQRYPHLCKVSEQNHEITAYIMARPGRNIIYIGPWVVTEITENPGALLEALALEIAPSRLRIGILETNSAALNIIRSYHSLQETEASWRMVLGSSELLGSNPSNFAIGSPAFG